MYKNQTAGELTDDQLDSIVGGKKGDALDVLLAEGEGEIETTLWEKVATVYALMTGNVVAGPNGEGDLVQGGQGGGFGGFGR